MKRTKQEAGVTREIVLDAALRVFNSKGYAAATLDDIASAANMTRGAIYWHFSGKEELYKTLLRERLSSVSHVYQEALIEGGTPVEIIRRLFVKMLTYVADDASYRAALELAQFRDGPADNAEGWEAKRSANREFVGQLKGLLDEAEREGQLHPGTDTEAAALSLFSLFNGMVFIWLIDPSLFALKERAATIIDQALRGLVA